jgi:RND family efflux transporter MFP subunit
MNTAFKKHPFFKAHQQWPMPQKASESPNGVSLRQSCVEASGDEVSCGKIVRRPLMTIGLLAGWLMIALMAGGCSKPAIKDPRLQSPRVEIFRAEAAGSNGRTFTGIVEARVQSDLGFRVAGKILERSVDVGQRVQKGQPLMRLDPEDLRLSAAAQQANVEAARAKYTQAKADETRSGMLVKSGVISPREYDQDRAALDTAKAQLEAAEAQARVSNNSSEYAILLADADGVIVRTLSEPGQVVAAGQTVIQLAHDGPREALINLPEGVRPDLGTTASARLYGQDQIYQANLRQLADAADPASRTFEARYVLEGEAASAPLGTTVTVTLVTKKASGNNSVRVPVGAVYDRGSGPGVWIVDDKSEVKFRRVQIASIGQEEVVVSHGVDAGENVVALGAHLLHEGQVVNLAKEEKTSYAKF